MHKIIEISLSIFDPVTWRSVRPANPVDPFGWSEHASLNLRLAQVPGLSADDPDNPATVLPCTVLDEAVCDWDDSPITEGIVTELLGRVRQTPSDDIEGWNNTLYAGHPVVADLLEVSWEVKPGVIADIDQYDPNIGQGYDGKVFRRPSQPDTCPRRHLEKGRSITTNPNEPLPNDRPRLTKRAAQNHIAYRVSHKVNFSAAAVEKVLEDRDEDELLDLSVEEFCEVLDIDESHAAVEEFERARQRQATR